MFKYCYTWVISENVGDLKCRGLKSQVLKMIGSCNSVCSSVTYKHYI